MKSFAQTTALITGASSGIGEALAGQLAEAGARLVITARSEDKLTALAEALRSRHGAEVEVIPGDLSVDGAAQTLYEQVAERGIDVDLLINNAAFGKWGALGDFDQATYAEMLQLNINSLVELTHLFLPGMLERGRGGIINVGSTASFIPVPYAAVYSASKAFVLMFSEALYGEVVERGVHVMALCPGGTRTNFATVANDAVDVSSMPMDSAEDVAREGLARFLEGAPSCIVGKGNGKVAVLPRLMSRKRVIGLARKAFAGRLEENGLQI